MLRRTGIALGLIGLLSGLVGALWQALFPTPDANIGAGLLVVIGIPLAVVGIVLFAVAVIVERSEASHRTRG